MIYKYKELFYKVIHSKHIEIKRNKDKKIKIPTVV